MDKTVRVLNVTTVLRAAGIESFIMNMYRNVDRKKIQFDFMVMRDEKEFYDEEIKSLGGRKFTISVSGKNTLLRIFKESIELYKFLKKNPYQIVHIHYTTPLRAFYLFAAKKAGVPVRIYHSHSAEVSGKSNIKIKTYNFCKKKITKWATDYFACSKAAAEWMYDKDLINSGRVQIIFNGIDITRFAYNSKVREEIRKQLNIENNFIIAHTGRFLPQKNHHFIIDVFREVQKIDPSSKLLLLGEGQLQDEIQQKVNSLDLQENVIFLGVKKNVEDYLSAADCYIMPSLYEGLPVAAVEAQCSGLPCVLSDNITKEVALTENTLFLSLDKPAEYWAEKILEFRQLSRIDGSDIIENNGYNIKLVAEKLQHTYMTM